MATAMAVIALLQYVRTLSPSVVNDDPSELQVLVWKLGIPHGTSYPLYVWLGRLFMSLPLGDDIAYRLNLFSAVLGALALFVLFMLTVELGIARSFGARCVGAGVATALVARSHTFWSISIVAAEYTLHVLLALVALLLLTRWMRLGGRGYLIAAFATLGAMFGNHFMTFALLPGTAVFVLLRERPNRKVAANLGLALLAGALALIVCNVFLFYLLWRRAVPFDHWQWVLSCPRFFNLPPDARNSFWYAWWYEVTCRQFQHELTGASAALRAQQLSALPHRVVAEYFPVAAALSLAGWGLLWRNWRVNILVSLIWIAHIYLVSSLSITIKSHVYLFVATLLAGACAGLAVSWLGETLAQKLLPANLRSRRSSLVIGMSALVCSIALGAANQGARGWYQATMARHKNSFLASAALPRMAERPDAKHDRTVHNHARRVVDALPPNAIVFTDWYIHYAIEYVARIERKMDGITVLESFPYGIGRREFVWDYAEIIRDPARTRPIFFVSVGAPPLDGYRLERRSDLISELVPLEPK
jgi:hypothetical protein